MVSDQFRRQLRQEADRWRAEGIIAPNQYQQLSEWYQFDALDTTARDRFIVVLLGLGSVLLGLGVITFVAANWQAISREVKVVMLMGLFISVNSIGFYLWRRTSRRPDGREHWQQRLGQGLLLLGSLILGANMALMGQMFHLGGSTAELCLAWGLGVLLMAYGLRLASLGTLAILLMGIGYWWGVQNLAWTDIAVWAKLLIQYMPLVASLLFIPLAYWCRSKPIFTMGAIAVTSSLYVILMDLGRTSTPTSVSIIALVLVLPPALLWSYDDVLWQDLLRRSEPIADVMRPFQALSQGLALLYLTVLFYVLSFRGLWFAHHESVPFSFANLQQLWTDLPLFLNLNLLFLTGLMFVQWVRLFYSKRTGRWRLDQTDGMVLVLLSITALLLFWHWNIAPIQVVATFLFNVMLFLLATGFLREGLADGQRRLFWSGLTLLTLQVLSRMLEYDTGLLLKSVAFVLCGVAVIAIGLWFERYVQTLTPPTPHLMSTSQEDSV